MRQFLREVCASEQENEARVRGDFFGLISDLVIELASNNCRDLSSDIGRLSASKFWPEAVIETAAQASAFHLFRINGFVFQILSGDPCQRIVRRFRQAARWVRHPGLEDNVVGTPGMIFERLEMGDRFA
jgi:hypothetical protein